MCRDFVKLMESLNPTHIDSPIASRVEIGCLIFPTLKKSLFLFTGTASGVCVYINVVSGFLEGHRLGTLHLHTNVPWSKMFWKGIKG